MLNKVEQQLLYKAKKQLDNKNFTVSVSETNVFDSSPTVSVSQYANAYTSNDEWRNYELERIKETLNNQAAVNKPLSASKDKSLDLSKIKEMYDRIENTKNKNHNLPDNTDNNIDTNNNDFIFNENIHSFNVGTSNYSKHKIQPWDIWEEYNLNAWDADIVKRVLREKYQEGMSKEMSRIQDYQKIIHVCLKRIEQLKKLI